MPRKKIIEKALKLATRKNNIPLCQCLSSFLQKIKSNERTQAKTTKVRFFNKAREAKGKTKNHTGAVFSSISGFLVGGVLSIVLMIAYPVYGAYYGFKNSVRAGVHGIGYGLYKWLSFPFRNAYRSFKAREGADDDQSLSFSRFLKDDFVSLRGCEMDVPVTVPATESTPLLATIGRPKILNRESQHQQSTIKSVAMNERDDEAPTHGKNRCLVFSQRGSELKTNKTETLSNSPAAEADGITVEYY